MSTAAGRPCKHAPVVDADHAPLALPTTAAYLDQPVYVQVRSLALHKGLFLRPREELVEAEQLRQACHDALCRTSSRRKEFPDARKQILYGYGDLNEYCRQLARPTFWGGEVEMMVITKMLKIPIHVYTPAAESGGCATLILWSQHDAVISSHLSDQHTQMISLVETCTLTSTQSCCGAWHAFLPSYPYQ